MPQNWQAEKDRLIAEHGCEVNLKTELEIMLLHQKIDLFREGQWGELLAIQTEQMKLLGDLMENGTVARRGPGPTARLTRTRHTRRAAWLGHVR
jgi:uncharacterized membrane protein